MLKRFAMIFAAAVLAALSATDRPAHRSDSGESVLPGGRILTPLGDSFITGPGPFGMAVSPSGRYVATADGGPSFSLTILDNKTGQTRRLQPVSKRNAKPGDEDEWRSVCMGVAFDGEARIYVSEGESGRVRLLDLTTGQPVKKFELNQGGYRDSYSGDLAFDSRRGILLVVDQANFRLAILNVQDGTIVASVRTGRLPFAVAYDEVRREAFVTNVGMFEYRAIPGADRQRAESTGLPFPAFGFPSKEALTGVQRATESAMVSVPPLGNPNVLESNSVAFVDLANPARPRVRTRVRTGLPFGELSAGGSSPSGVVANGAKLYVSNANQDTITVIDIVSGRRVSEIKLRIPGYESLRGVLPVGMAVDAAGKRLLIAEAGLNAIGMADLETERLLGHIPTAWFPTQVRIHGGTVFVSNAKGNGTGPNSVPALASSAGVQDRLRRGSITRFEFPSDLEQTTRQVLTNGGFNIPLTRASQLPTDLDHVVIIVKENRTYDEVFGDLGVAANGARAGDRELARFGRAVTPNHHAMAERWSASDNFYADSEVSVDGHHWIVDSYPNAWTTTTWNASYGGQKSFRLPTTAPGRLLFAESNSSVHPEEQLEAGSLWQHLERNHIAFRNFGEGFELAGNEEGGGLAPTGARLFTNVPMPDALYRNTSRVYPGFNMNIPDQFRAAQLITDLENRYGGGRSPFPRLLFVHLPNDHTDKERPQDGYRTKASYVADNDLALGRIVEYLSSAPAWKRMAIFITEDDAQGGVDHVDSHRTLLIAAGPYARKNWVSHTNASFGAMLRTAFEILRIPPLNQFDATAASLADCFTSEPDYTPYRVLPPDLSIFDPAKAKAAPGKPSTRMDDPRFLERERRRR